MNREQLIKATETKEYDFLRTDPHVKDKIMLLVPGGSHAYGTNIEGSDIDIRGIIEPSLEELIGLQEYEQFENRDTDTTLYTLKKIVPLLLNCNPNTIEILGTDPSRILQISKEGQMLVDNAGLFLSRRAGNSFGGYANQQLRRLQNALAHDSYPQAEKEKHILGSIKCQLDVIRKTYGNFTNKEIGLYVDKTDSVDMDSEIFMDLDLKHFSLRNFKNIYSQMSNVVRDYDKLNKRNKKKDEIHLNKHTMHLVRLYLMGTEVLEGKGINTYREKDREYLLSIRNGDITRDEVLALVDEYEKKFQYARDNSPLPEEPDYKKVEELIMEINRNILKKYGV